MRLIAAFSLVLLLLSSLLNGYGTEPIISEFMPNNERTLLDEDGNFSDWIEIHNPNATAINLEGYFLTDDPEALNKWAFPPVSVAGGGYLVVFASGKNRVADAAHLHTSFQLNADGGYLALVHSNGTTIVSGFPAYPATKEDVSYGSAQNQVAIPLLATAVPRILIPTNSAELPGNWSDPGFIPDVNWFEGSAPPALGFDTNAPGPAPSNLALGGSAVQSTTIGAATANLAINGSLFDASQTLNTDSAAFWQVTLAAEAAIHRITLRNRTSCCGSRLRDIRVEILGTNGATTNFTSSLLNSENAGSTFPNGPALLEVDLIALTGNPVFGRIVRVSRLADNDLSGSGGQGGADEVSTLSLAEVEVLGVAQAAALEVNLARSGNPAPTATQSTTSGSFTPNLGIDGDLGNFTHTTSTDGNPTWTLNLGRLALIRFLTLHNRDSCCGSRLRDITVQILAADGNTVVYTSALLNPENAGFGYPGGPDHLDIDLSGNEVIGQFVRVRRTVDLDLSGSGGQGNADEGAVLSLGEVIVLGQDAKGYRPFIRTDLQARMLDKNASAFARLAFPATDPATFNSLGLQLRYDDGFIAYLNGVEVARRNGPGSPAWDSSATAERSTVSAITPEIINLAQALPLLVSGVNIMAFHALNSAASDGDFLLQPVLTATRLVVTSNVFLTEATPGAGNETTFHLDEVSDTRFSVDRGFFEAPFSLSITSSTPDALIYYSFNCDEPGPGKGAFYTGPFTITNTTVVRARAYKAGWKATDVDTATYLFLSDVTQQAKDWVPTTGVPPPYFPASWGRNTVDYGMDPAVVGSYSAAQWQEALTQIPSMSVVTEMPNLFDATTGIYANADGHGEVWERPASLELLDPTNAVPGRFEENCGLRIRGGASRGSGFRKHSFRVFFRREYGAGKLNYPLFEDEGAAEFETFDLRTSQNYSWPREATTSNGIHDTMVREVFCRETLGAMGQPYRRSRYYHLYLNGQYWGIYETDERPEASYGQTYFGGSKTNFDVVKCGNRSTQPNFITEATDGNLIAFSNLWTMTRSMVSNPSASNYFRILGRNPNGTRNPDLPVMLDVDNLIDYMLEIFYSGDGDATLSSFLANNQPNNWFGMRDRTNPNVGFRFFNSDCEHTLGSPNSAVDRTGPFGGSNQTDFRYANPQWMHEELMLHAEYRQLFADHVQKHFFNGGALTTDVATNRFTRKANQLTKAIRAYSARWGDAVREPAYGESDWTNQINSILTGWFPGRPAIVLAQLRADGLFGTQGAPGFSQFGGAVPEGYSLELSHTNASGVVFYTTDGTDPRAVGGAVSPSAQSYAGSIVINAVTLVRARVLTGSTWSALVEYTLYPPQNLSGLRLTEIMYNPPLLGGVDGDEFEFVELKNAGATTLNLGGLRFSAGISFTFTNNTTLAPGAFLVLVGNAAQFAAKYPGTTIHGVYGGSLNNSGETLTLSHPLGARVLGVTYDDLAPWPIAPDNLGFSLVPVVPNANPDPDNAANWRASTLAGGSPGADDPSAALLPVLISEVLSHSETGQDFIELFNPNASAVDIHGWWLTDDASQPRKFRVPQSTVLEPLGYVVFTEADFNVPPLTPNSFSLNSTGDDVYLFSGDANTNLTGYSHGFGFGAVADGVTLGRYVISTGEEHFPQQTSATPGLPNSGPAVGPLVLSEVMYHPDGGGDEFIELRNLTTNPVLLYDPDHPTNAWKLTGVNYTFPTNAVLGSNGLLLVVGINPATFRAKYSVASTVTILGPYAGSLQDSGERLQLERPDVPDTNGVAYIAVDEVRYNDKAPWPAAADGSGPSLQRKNLGGYGNDPANWDAAIATPGADIVGGSSPAILIQPQSQTAVAGQMVTLGVTASGASLNYRWRFNGNDISGETRSNLVLASVQLSQAGSYSVVVFNEAGSAASAVAQLTVLRPPNITGQPTNQFVRPGSNAVFTVVANGNGTLRYQWNLNGTNLAGATSFFLVVTGANFSHEGLYSTTVADAVASIATVPARLTIAIEPIITQHPLSQTVVPGATVTLSLSVTNTANLPLGYRLRRNNSFVAGTFMMMNERTAFYTITNVQLPFTNYQILATNAAKPLGNLSSSAFLTLLADADGDGLPDSWESQFGFDTNSAADRVLDRDGDGMFNWEEYVAGTDPTNAFSLLEVNLTPQGSGGTVTFGAISNRTYTLQYSDALGTSPWSNWVDIGARPTNRIEQIVDGTSSTNRYYRVVTPKQP